MFVKLISTFKFVRLNSSDTLDRVEFNFAIEENQNLRKNEKYGLTNAKESAIIVNVPRA